MKIILKDMEYRGKHEYFTTSKHVNNSNHRSDCAVDFQQTKIADNDWPFHNRNRFRACN